MTTLNRVGHMQRPYTFPDVRSAALYQRRLEEACQWADVDPKVFSAWLARHDDLRNEAQRRTGTPRMVVLSRALATWRQEFRDAQHGPKPDPWRRSVGPVAVGGLMLDETDDEALARMMMREG